MNMGRKLRPGTRADSQAIRSAIFDMRSARDKLAGAGAVKAADYVRAAIKSAEGAERHNERRVMHTDAIGRVHEITCDMGDDCTCGARVAPAGADRPTDVRVTRAEVGIRSAERGGCDYCQRPGLPRVAWFHMRSDARGAPLRMTALPGFSCSRHATRAATDALFLA
jgi:hypothetical protein